MHDEDDLKHDPLGGAEFMQSKKKPFDNEKQRRAKLRFAKDHKDWAIEEWSKVQISPISAFPIICSFNGLTEI